MSVQALMLPVQADDVPSIGAASIPFELPSSRLEAWRWSDLRALTSIAAQPRGRGHDAAIAPVLGAGADACLRFVNGELDRGASRLGPVAIAPIVHPTLHPLGRLATGPGWSLTVPTGQKATIEIVHVAIGGASHLPGQLVVDDGATASLTESFLGSGWANRLTVIRLGRSARLSRQTRLLQDDGFASLRDEVELGDAAALTAVVIGAGGMDSRVDAALTLGRAASAAMGGALLADGRQRQECAVVMRHAGEDGASSQIWRAVSAGQATVSLAARVEVARHAQRTDGQQSLRGLLLARSASVNLKPELEIFADDVKCAHGATVGELDGRALFYLSSRGIDPVRARALMTQAFVADALDQIVDPVVRAVFTDDAQAWLERAR